jgi:serine/threonine protein kinase
MSDSKTPAQTVNDPLPRVAQSTETVAGPPGRTGEGKPSRPDGLRFLSPAQAPDELGRLGGYRILRVLGQGGMGMVLEAEDVRLKRRIAIKVMLPEVAKHESHRQRFLREAQAAAAVEHDHIIPILQVGEENGIPFIAMPFLKGEPLDACLKRGRLELPQILTIGLQTAEGLAVAHEHGLIHRDIKPANVWLEALRGQSGAEGQSKDKGGSTPSQCPTAQDDRPTDAPEKPAQKLPDTKIDHGNDPNQPPAALPPLSTIRVRILDFGLARVVGEEGRLTQSGAIMGTPAYMAPEQAAGKQVDYRADLFSLGVMLYEMSTGTMPFHGQNTMELFFSLANNTPPEAITLNPELPPALSQLIAALLEKDPAKRRPSAEDVRSTLKQLLPETAPVAPMADEAVKRRSFKYYIAASIVVLLALLFIGKFVIGPKSTGPAAPPETKVVDWQPAGWAPEDDQEIVNDRNGRRYFRRLARTVGGQKVAIVAAPRLAPEDPPTFYIMENKVWNDLYAVFAADPKSAELFKKYSSRPNCEDLVSSEPLWRRGALAIKFNPDPFNPQFFGVKGANGRLPVFRVTVTEAHCFAEWLDGLLPRRAQWLKAAGQGKDPRAGPFSGLPSDRDGLAVALQDGPWPVERGTRDESIYGCRQMASNGLEWVRDLDGDEATIPLKSMLGRREVYRLGQSYLASEPLTFAAMDAPRAIKCTVADPEVTFRVVFEE